MGKPICCRSWRLSQCSRIEHSWAVFPWPSGLESVGIRRGIQSILAQPGALLFVPIAQTYKRRFWRYSKSNHSNWIDVWPRISKWALNWCRLEPLAIKPRCTCRSKPRLNQQFQHAAADRIRGSIKFAIVTDTADSQPVDESTGALIPFDQSNGQVARAARAKPKPVVQWNQSDAK